MTTHECESSRLALGALVLGALPPGEREQVERHVAGCERCRAELADLAPLPGMLNLVRPDDVPMKTDIHPSPQLLESLLAAADQDGPAAGTPDSRRRLRAGHAATHARARRRAWLTGAGAAAAAIIIAAVVWLIVDATRTSADNLAAPPVTASATDPTTAISATVELTPTDDGTDLAVELTGVPSGQECDVVVVTHDGDRDVAIAWTASYSGTAAVEGHSRFATDTIDHLDVVTPDDELLVTVPLP